MRPSTLIKNTIQYWEINIVDPTTLQLIDADSDPTVSVRKNGASTGDAVTVTKRSATTGIYDCVYNPSGEVEGDKFTIKETAVVSGDTYVNAWSFEVYEVMRGTDGANTTAPDNSSITAIKAKTDSLTFTTAGRVDSTAITVSDKTGYSLVTAPLDAAATRSALGLSSANLEALIVDLAPAYISGIIATDITEEANGWDAAIPYLVDKQTQHIINDLFFTNINNNITTIYNRVPANLVYLNVDLSGRVLLQPTQTGVTIPTVTNISNAITVGTINTDVINANSIATDAITEIWAASSRTLTDKTGFSLATPPLDAAGIRSAIGLTTNNLETLLVDSVPLYVSQQITQDIADDANNWDSAIATINTRQTNDIIGNMFFTDMHSDVASIFNNLPANFASLGINASGHINRVTLVDTTTTNTDMRGTNNAMLASSYVSPPSEASIVSYMDANSTKLAAIYLTEQKIDSMLILDGAVYQLTTNALENAPSGGGGSSVVVNVIPPTTVLSNRVHENNIKLFYNEAIPVTITILDLNGDPLDMSAMTLKLIIEYGNREEILVINNADLTKGDGTVTFDAPSSITQEIRTYKWALRDITTDNTVLSYGTMDIIYAPEE